MPSLQCNSCKNYDENKIIAVTLKRDKKERYVQKKGCSTFEVVDKLYNKINNT